MLQQFFGVLVLSVCLHVTQAWSQEINLVDAAELQWKNENNAETVYDKEGKLFSGATIVVDTEGRKITYFYRNGQKNGIALARFEDGKPELEITYHKGNKNGEEIKFYENGNPQYKKTYKDNVLNGEEILFYENGKPQQQNFYENGLLHGECKTFDKDGNLIHIVNYQKGKKNGVERIITDNILREENVYADDVKNGTTKKYSAKYLTDEIPYVNGLRDGVHKIYKDDGSMQEIPYVKDRKNGEGVAYDPDKKIVEKVFYVDGFKNGISEKFYPSGQLRSKEIYKNDKKNGVSRWFDEKGNLSAVSYFADDVELAKVVPAENAELNKIYKAYRENKFNEVSNKRNLWYAILWLSLNIEKPDMLQALEKEQKMYAVEVDDLAVYKKFAAATYEQNNKNLFFGLTPFSYLVNLSADTEMLQKFAGQADMPNMRSENALQEAIQLNNLNMVKYVLHQQVQFSADKMLLYAIKQEAQTAIIKELIAAGADVNVNDDKGNNPIVLAIQQKRPDLIALLIENHAELLKNTSNGQSLLFYAYENNAPQEVMAQLLSGGIDVNQKDKQGRVLLVEALKNNDNQLVLELLRYGADVNLCDQQQESAISYILENDTDEQIVTAIFAKDVDVHNKMVKYDAPLWKVLLTKNRLDLLKIVWDKMPDITKQKDVNGEVPAQVAIEMKKNAELQKLVLSYVKQFDDNLTFAVLRTRNLSLFKEILQRGAPADAKDEDQTPLLVYMVKNGYPLDFVMALEEKNPQIDAVDAQGKSALGYAIMQDKTEIAENLLQHGADVNGKIDGVVYLATLKKEQSAMTKLLLQHGAKIDVIMNGGKTMLMQSVQQLNAELLQNLLAQNIDVNMRDENGQTALLYLNVALTVYPQIDANEYSEKFKFFAEELQKHGAKIDFQNADGETLLILIAKNHAQYYVQIAAILNELGANAALKDQYGKTAEEYFLQNQ